jgi:excisionase family DNA binding protein
VKDALVTAEYVAELLEVPVSWVREHTRNGTIPHIKLGRYVRYDKSEIAAWIEHLRGGGSMSFRKHFPSTRKTTDA